VAVNQTDQPKAQGEIDLILGAATERLPGDQGTVVPRWPAEGRRCIGATGRPRTTRATRAAGTTRRPRSTRTTGAATRAAGTTGHPGPTGPARRHHAHVRKVLLHDQRRVAPRRDR